MIRSILTTLFILTPLQAMFSRFSSQIAGLFFAEEMPSMSAEGTEAKSKLPTWAIVLIVVAALCLLTFCCLFILPILFGPAIGNVFSETIEQL